MTLIFEGREWVRLYISRRNAQSRCVVGGEQKSTQRFGVVCTCDTDHAHRDKTNFRRSGAGSKSSVSLVGFESF